MPKPASIPSTALLDLVGRLGDRVAFERRFLLSLLLAPPLSKRRKPRR